MGFGGTSPCAQQNGEIFIDKHPEELLMHGRFEPKPILFGTNKHEGSFVLGGKYLIFKHLQCLKSKQSSFSNSHVQQLH